MKTRPEELSVIEDMNQHFSDEIIPLIEIIADKHKKVYKINSETGEIETKPKRIKGGKIINKKVLLPPTENDIVTLKDLDKRL
ncbi:hypothetical protein, partial [Alkalibacillus haloalkaliphilus]|uniref:hypothetical protein n=1 Tax=Alkalibacillus haloalkaliphilus TaxID=94136 RepID=UPI0005908EFA